MKTMELTYRRDFIRNSLGHLETMRGNAHDASLFAVIRASIRDSIVVIRRLEAA